MGPIDLYGKNVDNFKWLLWSVWANVVQVSCRASLGQGNERLLKWSWSIYQDGFPANLEKSSSPEPNKPWGLIIAQIIRDRRSTKILKWWSYVDDWLCWGLTTRQPLRVILCRLPEKLTLMFDLFTVRSNLLPHAFVWALYIYMGKMLRIHILDISSVIQLNQNLMMSSRALNRHKIAKWANRKSKMATTAILKINFRHLFPNL